MLSTSATNSPIRSPRGTSMPARIVPLESCVAAENECNLNLGDIIVMNFLKCKINLKI